MCHVCQARKAHQVFVQGEGNAREADNPKKFIILAVLRNTGKSNADASSEEPTKLVPPSHHSCYLQAIIVATSAKNASVLG